MKHIELQRIIFLKLKLIRRGVGVYVAEQGVYVAAIFRTLKGVEVSQAAFEPFPHEMEDVEPAEKKKFMSETVKKCCEKAGIKGGDVYSSPAATHVVTRYFQVPKVSKREREDAIRFEGSRFVPYKLEETVVGYYVEPAQDEHALNVVFNAVRTDVLRDHVNIVEGGHVKVFDTEPPFYSMSRAVRYQEGKTEDSVCLLHFASDGSVSLSIFKNNVFYVCRDFFLSVQDTNHVERFFSEFQASTDYFNRQTNETGNVKKVYLAGDWNLPMWKQNLENFFATTRTEVKIADFPVKDGVSIDQASAFIIPIGLALRAIGEGVAASDVSLLESGKVAEERRASRKWSGVVALVLLLAGVGYYFGYYQLKIGHLQSRITASNHELQNRLLKIPALSDKTLRVLEKQLQDVRTREQIVKTFEANRSLLVEKLSIISQTISNPMWLSNLKFEEIANKGAISSVSQRNLTLDGYIYYREIPEEELRQINEFADSLRGDAVFMKGFNILKLGKIERKLFLNRNFTKFHITCSLTERR